MGKLEDLRVERVDGVDRPATGHHFVIVKSERTPAQLIEELDKSESLTDEQRELLETLKASLVEKDEDGAEDEADEAEESEEDADKEDGEEPAAEERAADDPGRPVKSEELLAALKTDEGRELVKSVITELVEAEMAASEEPEAVEKGETAPLRSRQPREQQREGTSVAKSKGEGMFSNIIFGQGRP